MRYAAETAPSFLVSGMSSGAVMQHVAQPIGTPAALAVLNRGKDPLLIAHITYAFFIACKAMLHPKPPHCGQSPLRPTFLRGPSSD